MFLHLCTECNEIVRMQGCQYRVLVSLVSLYMCTAGSLDFFVLIKTHHFLQDNSRRNQEKKTRVTKRIESRAVFHKLVSIALRTNAFVTFLQPFLIYATYQRSFQTSLCY